MSGLIKDGRRHQPAVVQSIGLPRQAGSAPNSHVSDLDRLRQALEAANAVRTSQAEMIEQFDAKMAQAIKAAEDRGREAGRKEAVRDNAASLASLGTNAAAARDAIAREMAALQGLSIDIASRALERLLGDSNHASAQLAAVIKHQFDQLEAQSVVGVEVAASDFPDAQALATLSESLGRPEISISADSGLRAGDCRIKLTLGTLEVGLRHQWASLKRALDDMLEAELP